MAQALHMARLLDATMVLVISKHSAVVRIVNHLEREHGLVRS